MARTRGRQTVRGLVLSMTVIGIVVAGIYLFIPHDDSGDPIKPVDYRVDLVTARRAAPYPVVAPEAGSLPKGWHATSVRYTPESDIGAVWHLGFLDDQREYLAIEQSDGRAAPFVDEVTFGAEKTGRSQQIEGDVWHRYQGPKYDALVREEKGVTTVVTGTASYARLATMAAALEAKQG